MRTVIIRPGRPPEYIEGCDDIYVGATAHGVSIHLRDDGAIELTIDATHDDAEVFDGCLTVASQPIIDIRRRRSATA